MNSLAALARFLGWLFPDIQPPPEPERRRLPQTPPKCYCGHAIFLHRDGVDDCRKCSCSYVEAYDRGPRCVP